MIHIKPNHLVVLWREAGCTVALGCTWLPSSRLQTRSFAIAIFTLPVPQADLAAEPGGHSVDSLCTSTHIVILSTHAASDSAYVWVFVPRPVRVLVSVSRVGPADRTVLWMGRWAFALPTLLLAVSVALNTSLTSEQVEAELRARLAIGFASLSLSLFIHNTSIELSGRTRPPEAFDLLCSCRRNEQGPKHQLGCGRHGMQCCSPH